jgi:septin family protein
LLFKIVDNPLHSDVIYIRQLLIEKNLQDLIDTTHLVHYANYRGIKIGGLHRSPSFLACDDLYEANKEKNKHKMVEEIQQKEEQMRQRFVSKVREKEHELRLEGLI